MGDWGGGKEGRWSAQVTEQGGPLRQPGRRWVSPPRSLARPAQQGRLASTAARRTSLGDARLTGQGRAGERRGKGQAARRARDAAGRPSSPTPPNRPVFPGRPLSRGLPLFPFPPQRKPSKRGDAQKRGRTVCFSLVSSARGECWASISSSAAGGVCDVGRWVGKGVRATGDVVSRASSLVGRREDGRWGRERVVSTAYGRLSWLASRADALLLLASDPGSRAGLGLAGRAFSPARQGRSCRPLALPLTLPRRRDQRVERADARATP